MKVSLFASVVGLLAVNENLYASAVKLRIDNEGDGICHNETMLETVGNAMIDACADHLCESWTGVSSDDECGIDLSCGEDPGGIIKGMASGCNSLFNNCVQQGMKVGGSLMSACMDNCSSMMDKVKETGKVAMDSGIKMYKE